MTKVNIFSLLCVKSLKNSDLAPLLPPRAPRPHKSQKPGRPFFPKPALGLLERLHLEPAPKPSKGKGGKGKKSKPKNFEEETTKEPGPMIIIKGDKEDTPALMLKCHPGTTASTVTAICKQIAEKVNYVPLPPRNAHLTEKKPERPLQPKPRLPGYESPNLPTATRADPPYMTVPGPSGYQRYSDELPDEEEDEIFTMVYFEAPDGDCQDGNASAEGHGNDNANKVRTLYDLLEHMISELECLQALELCGWDIPAAVQLLKTSPSINTNLSRSNRNKTLKTLLDTHIISRLRKLQRKSPVTKV
ncbi:uncharacterized protein LOC126912456 [Spodoptera frugiperda]|uniref:Uncharacterized protein LOC126912456 n=1 Tax=Spodoptera frugiperda TaxID=7108 RepID=A0A9R0F2R3_SPOFR|nr:uncharacterized protein LOC126912456 [Spodoptera frugiperda]